MTEKLRLEFKERKKDPYQRQCDKVLNWTIKPTVSRAGRAQFSIDVVTEYRKFRFWVSRAPKWDSEHANLQKIRNLDGRMPETITYRKDGDFYKVYAYNEAPDEVPTQRSSVRRPKVQGDMPQRSP